ncbi:Acyl-coenzyme A thioesterase THEM4 [Colletotrichum higginsianum]|nr:Acyl-coenzyme A thioesterase THEM4 [Colletotrichum higginsianum]
MMPRPMAASRVLRDLSARRASRPPASFSSATVRPFSSTAQSRLKALKNPPPSPAPYTSQFPPAANAADAALANLSHLTPAQITALLSTPPKPPPPPPGGVPQPDGQQPPRSRLSRSLWALAFFVLGYKLTADEIATWRFAYPFMHPPVETKDPDEIAMYREHATYDALEDYPILQSMVPQVNEAGTRATPTDWEQWQPYEDFSAETLSKHLCGGTLNNPNALGLVHLVFRNRLTGEIILAIMFGDGTSGWPSIVHGGMLSTIMDEAMARLAALNFSANTAVTARLSMDFKIPVSPRMLYIVRVNKVLPEYQKQGSDEDKTDRKMWIVGRMEDPDGATVLEAKGLFVVPKGGHMQPLGKHF